MSESFRELALKNGIKNWQLILPQCQSKYVNDLSISPCEEYVIARTRQHLFVYDVVENKVHAEIGSIEIRPTYCYWISPQKIYFRFGHINKPINTNPPTYPKNYGTAIFDIITSEIWILMKDKELYPNYSQLFVANNVITAIDNQSITMYDLKTCTTFNKKFDFGANQFKYQCIEPTTIKSFPFIATKNFFCDDAKQIYLAKCMKFISNSDAELLLIPKKTYTKIINTELIDVSDTEMSENYSDSDDYYNSDSDVETEKAKYDATLELYVFDLSSNELHATNALFNLEFADIVYMQHNTQWNWCNSSTFLLYTKIEGNIEIMECCINSDYNIGCNTVSTIPYTKQMGHAGDVMNAAFFNMQYIHKQNILIKGRRIERKEPHGWDGWVTRSYYKHNLILLNNSTDQFKQTDIKMEATPFIDQLSGVYCMQNIHDPDNSIYGFSVMKNGSQIGQILLPNTEALGEFFNGRSVLNIGTSSVVCIHSTTYSCTGIFFGSLFSQQEYLVILEKIHKRNKNANDGFGKLPMTTVKLITEFLGTR